jgi:hypothetical protein
LAVEGATDARQQRSCSAASSGRRSQIEPIDAQEIGWYANCSNRFIRLRQSPAITCFHRLLSSSSILTDCLPVYLVKTVDRPYTWFNFSPRSFCILFSYVVIRCKVVTLCRFLAMVSRSRAIPVEEWERNKETIKDLFARKRLTQVIEEMKREHNFDAT